MLHRRLGVLAASALTMLFAIGPRVAAAQTIPNTAAGRALRAWLDAFNSGDTAVMNAYYKQYEPAKTAESQIAFRNATGGFELLRIEKNDPLHIESVVKEKKSETNAYVTIDVKSGDASGVGFSILAIPSGATAADFTIDAAERAKVIDGAIEKLNESYVFPDAAKKMGDAVRDRQKRGEYDAVTNGMTFAALLTTHFQDVSHDKHLRVNFTPPRRGSAPQPQGTPAPLGPRTAEQCGFVKTETLAGNVGYLKFNGFASPSVCGSVAGAAMTQLAGVDALIIDLRDNGGGDPAMVAFISSYLLSKPTHLNDLWTRSTNSTQEFWTSKDVTGKRLPDDKPVFLLTSKRTFSGAEEFTYNLKSLKRATVIGETTGGGAHPVAGQRIDDRFVIGVPFARAINPITKTNWEGTGVDADVKVPADEALEIAKKMIASKRIP